MEENRKLTIPGELLGEGSAGQNAFIKDSKVYSKILGFAEEKNGSHFIIPISGVYNPKKGDKVIGKVEDVPHSIWVVNINSPYNGILKLDDAVDEFIDLKKADITKYYDKGDYIFTEISSVSKSKNIQLSMRDRKCRKLKDGRILRVVPAKVPRIIGKAGSMVEMIKEITGTQIVVGQNGIVWVKGENESIAADAIKKIEHMAHTHGLTDYIKKLLEDEISSKEV